MFVWRMPLWSQIRPRKLVTFAVNSAICSVSKMTIHSLVPWHFRHIICQYIFIVPSDGIWFPHKKMQVEKLFLGYDSSWMLFQVMVWHCQPTSYEPPKFNLPWTKWPPFWQTTISNAFSWMKMYEFHLKFHRSLFPRVQLTIFQHCFR